MKLFNIHNTENFYKVIDACQAPVLVSASDGRSEDFRNNTLLREIAENASQGDGISEIELHTTCPQDNASPHRLHDLRLQRVFEKKSA